MSKIEEEDERPFVNEECGDTMWDAVLADHEARLAQQNLHLNLDRPAINVPTPTENPSPKTPDVSSH